MKKYRNEWKYQTSKTILSQVSNRLGAVMESDAHANEYGKYTIHSMYFDDYEDSCARENVSGEGIRFKYRIRYYGDNSELLFLEKKEKKNSYCHKKTCQLTKNQYLSFLTGDVNELLWSEEPLIREFSTDILTKYFTPKSIVSYERQAFVEPISNVRITFDSDIMASNDFDEFLTGKFERIPIMEESLQILEVKFDSVLPSYIRKTIEGQYLNQQSFSKYYYSRMELNKYYSY